MAQVKIQRLTTPNPIPVARQLFRKLDLDGRTVSLDALHTQAQSARQPVLEHGADYLLTVKDNQPTLRQHIERLVDAPPAAFSPRETTPTLAGRREITKGQLEVRLLRCRAASPEAVGFLLVEQVALVRRQWHQHAPEGVAPVTRLPPSALNAAPITDFWGVLKAEHDRYALRCLQARQPSLQSPS